MSSSTEIKALFDRFVMKTYTPDIALVKGRGTRVWDPDGKVVLNEKSGGERLTDEEIATLHESAESVLEKAQEKVDAKRAKRRR